MKQQFLTQAITILALLITTTALHGQVTIGSGEAPNAGALLDLKMSGNTTKGLALPRVELSDLAKLKIGTAAELTGSERDKHVGLVVYHTNKCTLNGKGLYVWTGSEWNKIGENVPAGLNLSKTYFDLPSGKDARTLDPQNLEISWLGGLVPTWTAAANNGLSAVSFTGTPLAPNPLVNSPETMVLLPDAMTVNPLAPWQSKETKLTFTYTECGQTKEVILNQTNYALKVNGGFANSQIKYEADANASFEVEGNVQWTTEKNDPFNALTVVNPTIGSIQGSNRKDGTTEKLTPDFEYSFTAANNRRYAIVDIMFKDTENPKRFDPITVSLINCKVTGELSMSQYAEQAGFSSSEISAVTDAQAGSSAIKPNGVQLHKDQNGNLFLSGDFGSAGRWMLNNVSATTFAQTGRTGTDNTVVQQPAITNAKDYALPLYTTNISVPTFPRAGYLYNWAAVTNSKGGPTGINLIDDGELSAVIPARIQGICANGWHVPSDAEWTALENEINTNTSKYSTLPDANGTITIGAGGYRGTTHGSAMKDACNSTFSGSSATGGASNIISSKTTPGFCAFLVGQYIDNYTSKGIGDIACFWTASGGSSSGGSAWMREFGSQYYGSNAPKGRRLSVWRYYYNSVRCKKD